MSAAASGYAEGGGGKKWQMSRPNDLEASVFAGKNEEWARWKEQVQDYAETIHGGLKHCLETIGDAKAEVTDTTFKAAGVLEEEWKQDTPEAKDRSGIRAKKGPRVCKREQCLRSMAKPLNEVPA